MQEPSAPPYNFPVAYPTNAANQGYTRMSDNQYNNSQDENPNFQSTYPNSYSENNTSQDEMIARNLNYQLNNDRNTRTDIPTQVIIINDKQKNDTDIAKIGCAAALLTFCCMQ